MSYTVQGAEIDSIDTTKIEGAPLLFAHPPCRFSKCRQEQKCFYRYAQSATDLPPKTTVCLEDLKSQNNNKPSFLISNSTKNKKLKVNKSGVSYKTVSFRFKM